MVVETSKNGVFRYSRCNSVTVPQCTSHPWGGGGTYRGYTTRLLYQKKLAEAMANRAKGVAIWGDGVCTCGMCVCGHVCLGMYINMCICVHHVCVYLCVYVWCACGCALCAGTSLKCSSSLPPFPLPPLPLPSLSPLPISPSLPLSPLPPCTLCLLSLSPSINHSRCNGLFPSQ